MKYSLSQKDINEFDKLLWCKETNIGLASLINYAMEEGYHSLYPIKAKNEKEYQNLMIECSGILEEDGYENLINEYPLFDFKELNENEYKSNEFYKQVGMVNGSKNNLTLFTDFYDEFEPFLYDDFEIQDYYKEIYKIGYFKNKFPFLALKENNKVWMSITPHEINTMKLPLSKMKGNVLIFGLGLGYFAYKASLKEDVKKVTIIEYNDDVIFLYNKYIKDKLNTSKIRIIKGDAFDFFNEEYIKKENIDSIFIDTYHNGEEINQYIKYKNKQHKIKCCKNIHYWIETSLLSYFRRYVISLMNEEIEGFDDKDYMKAKSNDDQIINALHFLLKERQIKSFEDIKSILNDTSLKQIAEVICLKH